MEWLLITAVFIVAPFAGLICYTKNKELNKKIKVLNDQQIGVYSAWLSK